jgi:splicing factor 45
MAPEPAPTTKSGKLSLYANLLDPSSDSSPGTISRAPVVFKQSSEGESHPDDAAAEKQQISAGSLIPFFTVLDRFDCSLVRRGVPAS